MKIRHQWGSPEVAVVQTREGIVHVPIQKCGLCNATRNPITTAAIYTPRKSRCARVMREAPVVDFSRKLERVKSDLEAFEQEGMLVDRLFGGRRSSHPVPELPLPYKD